MVVAVVGLGWAIGQLVTSTFIGSMFVVAQDDSMSLLPLVRAVASIYVLVAAFSTVSIA